MKSLPRVWFGSASQWLAFEVKTIKAWFLFIFFITFTIQKLKCLVIIQLGKNLKFLTSEKIATIQEDNLELQFNNPKFWRMGAKNNPDLCNNKLC